MKIAFFQLCLALEDYISLATFLLYLENGGDSPWVDMWVAPPVLDHLCSDKLVIPGGGKGGTL